MLEKSYSLKQTAEILNISESTLRKLVKKRMIEYYEVGDENSRRKRKLFLTSYINNFIEKSKSEII